MEIRTRQDALAILGLESNATASQIKSAYRNLSKIYHPDVADPELAWQYNDIKDAYEFLQNEPEVDQKKILGASGTNRRAGVGASASATARMQQSKKAGQDIARARKNEKQRKKERQEELAKKAQELHQAEEDAERRKEEVTKEALEHIKAIRMAEMISEMLGDDKK